ncbi:MAG: hypothetical protein JHC84_02080 [Solirubrobacteraceae bacterium]|nr:hypothetical protein [Solirubrobacteraceae bacterium]
MAAELRMDDVWRAFDEATALLEEWSDSGAGSIPLDGVHRAASRIGVDGDFLAIAVATLADNLRAESFLDLGRLGDARIEFLDEVTPLLLQCLLAGWQLGRRCAPSPA